MPHPLSAGLVGKVASFDDFHSRWNDSTQVGVPVGSRPGGSPSEAKVIRSEQLAGQKRVRESMIAKLIPLDGSRPILITQDVTLVGRKRGIVDVYVNHASISKLHCLIAKTDGLLFFRDLGSTNGTKVNGQRVIRGALLPGDELAFASVKYRVHLGPDEPVVGHHEPTEMIAEFTPAGDDSGEFAAPDEFDGDHSDSDVRLLPSDSSL